MPEREQAAREALAASRVLFSREQVQAAYDARAEAIAAELAGRNPLVVAVMNGGLQPTAELTGRMDFPHQQDFLHASRYAGETRGGELRWKAKPSLALAGRDVLVIDDVLDRGDTLAAIIDELSRDGPRSLRTAVLVEKDNPRRAPGLHADFTGLHAPNRYLIGCGMDYHEYFRNLDYIAEVPV